MDLKKLTGVFVGFALFANYGPVWCQSKDHSKPRIIITTDINLCCGDPDDMQSMSHVLWFANELDIKSIIPENFDRFDVKESEKYKGKKPKNYGGITAVYNAIDAYEADYANINNNFRSLRFPDPDSLRNMVQESKNEAVNSIIMEARQEDPRPLYILVWGDMIVLKEALFEDPSISRKLRVLSIATNTKKTEECRIINWNGRGRDEIFNDSRFDDLWWLENDWSFYGMFKGEEPKQMLKQLEEFGELGAQIREVIDTVDWVHYFRAGDTPTVLYMIQPGINLDDPTEDNWAGKFIRPFPESRANFYTDYSGGFEWNYENPCETWENADKVYEARVNSFLTKRDEMYEYHLRKLNKLYNK